jgi:hypothetical protein
MKTLPPWTRSGSYFKMSLATLSSMASMAIMSVRGTVNFSTRSRASDTSHNSNRLDDELSDQRSKAEHGPQRGGESAYACMRNGGTSQGARGRSCTMYCVAGGTRWDPHRRHRSCRAHAYAYLCVTLDTRFDSLRSSWAACRSACCPENK